VGATETDSAGAEEEKAGPEAASVVRVVASERASTRTWDRSSSRDVPDARGPLHPRGRSSQTQTDRADGTASYSRPHSFQGCV